MYYFFGFYWMWVNQTRVIDNPISGKTQVLDIGWNKVAFQGTMEKTKTDLIGSITDIFGESRMSDILLTESHLTFTKEYDNHLASIHIIMECQQCDPSLWTGSWGVPELEEIDETAHGPIKLCLSKIENPNRFKIMPNYES